MNVEDLLVGSDRWRMVGFGTQGQLKPYLGWYPQLSRSGSSIDGSELAKRGVRPARNVLGQMTVIMLSSRIRPNAFRDVYRRLTGRGMRPAAALGQVAGKLSVVLYGMLKNMTPYDERKHRNQLGLISSARAAGSRQQQSSVGAYPPAHGGAHVREKTESSGPATRAGVRSLN